LEQSAILALDHTVLDADQVENLIKFTPSKDEIELLKVARSLRFLSGVNFKPLLYVETNNVWDTITRVTKERSKFLENVSR